MVYPLSEYTGKMKTKDWKSTPSFPPPATDGKGEVKWVIPDKFFDELPLVMKMVPPRPGEEAIYGTIQSVLDAAAKDPQIKATLNETAAAAARTTRPPSPPWRSWTRCGRRIPNATTWHSPRP